MTPKAAEPDWVAIVAGIQAGDEGAMTEFYHILQGSTRYFLANQIGRETDDHVHEVFVHVVTAIKKGQVRHPERMAAFIHTVRRREVFQAIARLMEERRVPSIEIPEAAVVKDSRPNPEELAIHAECTSIANYALGQLREKDRRILEEFYLKERSWPEIARDMGLTGTTFRLGKNRAKARFVKHAKRLQALGRPGISRKLAA
jgi:RNA polymerase sigma factor (sigma-70 family)